MKKKWFAVLLGAAMLALPVLGLTGCDGETQTFSYDDGISASGNYDSSVFYRNDLTVDWFADPGVIYAEDGYFYAYGTASDMSGAIRAWRSKNLADWEFVGVVYNCDADSWAYSNVWAPEVLYYQTAQQKINDEPGLYYMYFSAAWKDYATGGSGYDNLRLSVAVSDSPAGPFVDVGKDKAWKNADGTQISVAEFYGRDYDGSKPIFRFEEHLTEMAANGVDLDGRLDGVQEEANTVYSAIDASPFLDEDGTMYLYFVQHISTGSSGNLVCGMRMIDPITPDYSTVTPLAASNSASATGSDCDYFEKVDGVYKPMDDPSVTLGAAEGEINEAPFMQRHTTVKEDGTEVTKYYLTYSAPGYTDPYYSVCLATSDSPLGSFKKIQSYMPVHGIDYNFDHMSGTGHHCFVRAGEEDFIFYHAHCDRSMGNGNPRALAADRVYWFYSEELGYDIYHSDGPSYSLNPVPEVTSGYTNIALDARVTATNAAEGSAAALLHDGMSAIHTYDNALEFLFKGSTKITLTFGRAYEVNALFIYNSRNYANAFSEVGEVRLTGADGKVYVVKDLAFDPSYFNETEETIRPGAAAVMAFDPISVTQIEITIDTPIVAGAAQLAVDEIKVMGK